MSNSKSKSPFPSSLAARSILVALLTVVAGLLFVQSFNPDLVLFSNDFPYGGRAGLNRDQLFEALFGSWSTLNWVGYSGGQANLNLSTITLWLLGPLWYAKLATPLSLLFLGGCAAVFFRSIGLSYVAVVLGALAAMLNSDFFSNACWGLVMWSNCFALSFLALAALAGQQSRHRWLRVVLGGAALGLAVADGFDVGALFSLGVAAFVLYQAVMARGPKLPVRLGTGILVTAIVAAVSALVAFQTINSLVGKAITGVSGMKAEERSTVERWDWATQWSLPKKEILSLAVPGLFGYRMDTPNGGSYWGQIGRQPGWEEHHQGMARFVGSGIYAGILVLAVAAWAAAQSLRRKQSVFSETDRKWIWFWGGMCVVSILLAFGRYAPFYRLVYALPFFSTIRNPVKFMHVANWALVILFAYGVNGLVIHYASKAKRAARAGGSWWKQLSSFDRKWVTAGATLWLLSAVGWLVYATSSKALEAYLVKEAIDPGLAPLVAGFSIGQVGVFVLLFGIALALLTLTLTGFFHGARSPWLGVVLGLFLVFDLSRADQPWIQYVNYKDKYATNPVIDFLRDKPYEHRVAILPFPMPDKLSLLDQLYRIEWHQHLFPYYNIQSLDIVQMPRVPEEIAAFEAAFQPDPTQPATVSRLLRRWELTNTRYLLGPAGFVEPLNTQLGSGTEPFRIAMTFDIVPKPGVTRVTQLEQLTAVASPTGPYAIIDLTAALPRASLYTDWQVETNDAKALEQLASPDFDPAQVVLVDAQIASPASPTGTNASPDAVEVASYARQQVKLQATNAQPAILLLNDKYDPNWNVTVDGVSVPLLRCNSIMRGVFLDPGEHTIEFRFKPPVNSLYVTMGGLGVSLLLLGVLIVSKGRERSADTPDPKAAR